ncbi:MAG: hypothetical protein TECD_00259 [Hyphomicrobiaceae bacterium hypho_1]
MYSHVSDLQTFYACPLGLAVRRLVTHRIRARWRHLNGMTLIGLGFAAPYLGTFHGEAFHVAAMMPAAQGTLVWPREGPTQCVMVEETHLPLNDNSVDRLLAIHCIENTLNLKDLLREMWRVLSPEGRIILIVPNRRSVWAITSATPFGRGRSYSRIQLQNLLQKALFVPTYCTWALHFPPVERQAVLKSMISFERFGAQFFPGFGGIIIVEARKELSFPNILRSQFSVRLFGKQIPAASI